MTNLTDADLAAMKARADAAIKWLGKGSGGGHSAILASLPDVPALLSEVAALRKQIDLAETCISAISSLDVESNELWSAIDDYDAAKEALDHE